VHQTPWLASVWARLSIQTVNMNHKSQKIISQSSLVVSKKSHTANSQSEAYEYAALAEQDTEKSKKYAQRAVMMAPWRLSAWKAL
jgi:superkiller protein 3